MIEVAHEEYSKDPNGFEKLLIDAEKPLKEFANATECPECGQSRWKNVKDRNEERKQIPSKVIWYFPPIPRFKRLFRSIECAENLTWHASERIEDGPKQPGDDIDTYLAPLIEDLKLLWENGVECYDAYREEVFNLRSVLLWTINDFPAYGTLLDILGKCKDGLNARRDLVDLKLRPELAPISSEKKIFIPPACYTLTKEEKRCVLKTLSRIKVPEGYSSNIRNLVSMTDLKLNSLKSHDCHVLTQQLFPIAIRSVLPKHLRYAITRLCIFFNYVCNKVLDAQQLDKLEEDIMVSTELEVGNNGVLDKLRWIAHGPHPFVITYSGYAINACRYHTKSSEKDRSVQNSGVSLVAKTMQVSSSKDKNLIIGDMPFYGVIQEIWELNYNTFNVPVFKCDWVQNSGGVRIDELELKDKIFTTVEAAFVIDPRSRKNVLQTAGISFRQFKNWLTTKYIMAHKDAPQLLQVPPEKYSFIEQNHWEEFVRSRLSETFQDEISMNTDSSSVNRHCSNDVLTQALGTKEHNGRVHGVGGYVTPTTYFHSVKKTSKDEANILVENEELRRPIMLEGIEEKGKRIEVESLDKPKQKEKKGKEVMKMNEPELDVLKERDLIKMPTEKEVVCESTSTLPLALKSILRYAEKLMEKNFSITISLPPDLFGISRKTYVLREDIVDLYNMNDVKTFTFGGLYDYVFVDSSLISSGNTQESRIRNLCSRLMVSKPNQVVLAPSNPGGHWTLLAINAYEDTMFYLDSLRTTSKASTRYVTDT
ncbi:putative polyprotein [Cucumis melo var. makuwa]|uniref:Putative polyprotein n=1 Tax=Cucumis melo var. makuwa TaxID=1194695 RepID=A0A5D3E1P0_CUCMM|nr:putative polyprotein [Cucumis melo var. makuwa]